MRLLVTGFEPFGNSQTNPSEQVVKALEARDLPGIELITAILPVDAQRGPQALSGRLESIQPQAVICLGEARRRAAVSFERVAVNLLDFTIPDNAGAQLIDQPVVPGGPAAYFSTLPLRKMLTAVMRVGVPAELSLSAGSYLCNQVMYTLLHHLAVNRAAVPAGFIHLPALPEQAAGQNLIIPTMSLESSLLAVRTAIQALSDGATP